MNSIADLGVARMGRDVQLHKIWQFSLGKRPVLVHSGGSSNGLTELKAGVA
jgi:hypothetical protein